MSHCTDDESPQQRSGAARFRAATPARTHSVSRTLYLRSIDRHLPVDRITCPAVAVLIIEDLCWQIAIAAWSARRPPLWRRTERRRWRAEQKTLNAKRHRILEMSGDIGLTDTENATNAGNGADPSESIPEYFQVWRWWPLP